MNEWQKCYLEQRKLHTLFDKFKSACVFEGAQTHIFDACSPLLRHECKHSFHSQSTTSQWRWNLDHWITQKTDRHSIESDTPWLLYKKVLQFLFYMYAYVSRTSQLCIFVAKICPKLEIWVWILFIVDTPCRPKRGNSFLEIWEQDWITSGNLYIFSEQLLPSSREWGDFFVKRFAFLLVVEGRRYLNCVQPFFTICTVLNFLDSETKRKYHLVKHVELLSWD